MSDSRPYSYTILRYVHDVTTGEFVNVGVILHVPSSGLLEARLRSSIGRLRSLFPDLDRKAFTRAMHAIGRSIDEVRGELQGEALFNTRTDAAAIAARALPRDDSSLQWSSPAGTGLTSDPSKTLDRLYDRFVSRYDDRRSPHRRTDDDVWRPVRQKLEERDLLSLMQEKTIRGRIDEIAFRHAWQNGTWHVYEPLSFDLADADGIRAKAREWLGHLMAVADDTTERFAVHFIVGAPAQPELRSDYASAIAILRKAPVTPEIFEEGEIDRLVAQLESDVRAHARAT